MFKVILTLLLLSSTVFANQGTATAQMNETVLIVKGSYQPKTIFGLIFASLSERKARKDAKKNFKKECKDKFNGKLKGKLSYRFISFNSGDMTARVEATGTCKY